jgi:hypothetical protein
VDYTLSMGESHADDSIKKILADRIGNSRERDLWVEICEGSPKVA